METLGSGLDGVCGVEEKGRVISKRSRQPLVWERQ